MGLKWLLFGILMAFDGLFLAAVISKYREVKQASKWSAAPGKIVSSRSEARKVDKSTGSGRDRVVDSEIRNFASVSYTFQVNGQRQTGNRIAIAHDVGNYRVAEKLARYPVGAPVTVYYDPAKPRDNVLERDMPSRSFEIAIWIGALIAVVGLFFVLITEDVSGLLQRLIPDHGQGSASSFLVAMGAFAVLIGYRVYQRGKATFNWPSIAGKIAASDVDTVQIHYLRINNRRRYRYAFRARTIYDYKVDGVGYRSDRTSYGSQVVATFRYLAKKSASQFVAGDIVEIFYNPSAPAEAVLVRGAPGQWVIWVIAVAMFVGAGKLLALF